MQKKGKTELHPLIWIMGLVIIGVIVSQLPFAQEFAISVGLAKEEIAIEDIAIGVCPEDIAMKFDDFKLGEIGTDPGLSSVVFLDTNKDGIFQATEDKGDIADDGSTTVPAKMDFLVLGGWNAGTGGTYYVTKVIGNTDCEDPIYVSPELALVDTTVSWVVLNDDFSTQTGTALTLDGGETTAITVRVSTTLNSYYGNPELGKCNVLVLEFNRTAYDPFVLEGAIIGDSATTPATHTVASTTNTTQAWFFDGITSTPQEFIIHIDAQDPDPTGNGGIGLYVYDCDYDLDAKTNALIIGVEDENDNDLGSSTDQFQHIVVS